MFWNHNCVFKVSRVCVVSSSLTLSDAEGHGDDPVGAGDSVQTADEVRQVVQHTQVVLHHNNVPETQTMMTQLQNDEKKKHKSQNAEDEYLLSKIKWSL